MTDEQLVSACRSGDNKAWEQLYSRYKPLVRAVANRYYLYGYESEDLIQEGMSGLCSAVIGFKEGSFSAYAQRCVRNRIIDTVKRSLNHFSYETLSDFYFEEEHIEQDIIDREDKAEFFERLKKELSALEYSVIELYLEGFTSTEICQRLNLTSKSVDNALTRAKHKIKKQTER